MDIVIFGIDCTWLKLLFSNKIELAALLGLLILFVRTLVYVLNEYREYVDRKD